MEIAIILRNIVYFICVVLIIGLSVWFVAGIMARIKLFKKEKKIKEYVYNIIVNGNKSSFKVKSSAGYFKTKAESQKVIERMNSANIKIELVSFKRIK